jgi:hypothetical protein
MKWTPALLKEHYDERLNKLDADFTRKFEGFPQEYATKNENDALRTAMQDMRADHATRREVDEIKDRLNESTGRRTAIAASISVVVAIFAITFGVIVNNQVTRAEISDQINREAPWNKDKAIVEGRISKLESQNAAQRLQISQLQTQIKFFCATRIKVNLPGC